MTTPELILLIGSIAANGVILAAFLWRVVTRKPSIYREARYIINHADKVLYR